MRLPSPPLKFGDLSFGTPLMWRLKGGPLGAPLPVWATERRGRGPGVIGSGAAVSQPERVTMASVARLAAAPSAVRASCIVAGLRAGVFGGPTDVARSKLPPSARVAPRFASPA